MAKTAINLFSMLTRKHSLQELLSLGEELLGNPLSYSTPTMEILAISAGYPETDRGSRELFLKNLTGENYASILAQMERRTDSTPFFLEGIYVAKKCISKVFIAGRYQGYLSVCECKNSFDKLDLELLQTISEACALSLNVHYGGQVATNGEGNDQHNVVEELVKGNTQDILNVKKQIEYSKLDVISKFCVAAICPNENTKTGTLLILNAMLEKNKYSGCKLWVVERYKFQVLVIGLPDGDFGVAKELLGSLVRDYKLGVGVSDCFDDVLNLRHYYLQAKNALIIGKRYVSIDKVLYYNDVKVYAIISEFLKQNRTLQDYCANELSVLRSYDQANETDYYDTLEAYVFSGKNAIETGKKLFVHKNTVNYRINRMLELFGIDVENFEMVLRLQISFLIEKMWAR